MNNQLKNPIVAVILALAAATMLWIRVVSPLLGNGRQEPGYTVEVPPAPAQPIPMVQPSAVIPPTASTSSTPYGLARMGWKREANRDPFLLEPRQGQVAWWIEDSLAPASRTRRTSKVSASLASVGKLDAVAIGPWGAKAMVDNRIVGEGDILRSGRKVERITTDSVTLVRDSSLVNLKFRNGGKP